MRQCSSVTDRQLYSELCQVVLAAFSSPM